MSRCEGVACTHPEHADPATMPAWQWQRRQTHSGDEAAERYYAERDAQAKRIAELFGGRP